MQKHAYRPDHLLDKHWEQKHRTPKYSQVTRIPNRIFTFFNLGAPEPFRFWHYLCLRSMYDVNHPEDLVVIGGVEPIGEWWEHAHRFARFEHAEPVTSIFGRILAHRAHRSDVMRLQRLIDRGGIYLDLDTICVRSVSSLLGHRAVMGHQCPDGLCNAVILSVPGNPFLLEWLEEYRSFDGSWCNHSVFVPWTVSRRQHLSGCLTILPRAAFFDPSYDPDGISKMHDQDVNFPGHIHTIFGTR